MRGNEEGGNTALNDGTREDRERRGGGTGGNTGARIRGDEERGNTEKLPALRIRCDRCAAAVKKLCLRIK